MIEGDQKEPSIEEIAKANIARYRKMWDGRRFRVPPEDGDWDEDGSGQGVEIITGFRDFYSRIADYVKTWEDSDEEEREEVRTYNRFMLEFLQELGWEAKNVCIEPFHGHRNPNCNPSDIHP